MAGKFEIISDRRGLFRFRLKASNGEIILAGQAYKAKSSAKKGIASVQKNSGNAARYDRRTNKAGKDYFVLKAANHQVIGNSEAYESKASMENGIKSVMRNGSTTKIEDQS